LPRSSLGGRGESAKIKRPMNEVRRRKKWGGAGLSWPGNGGLFVFRGHPRLQG